MSIIENYRMSPNDALGTPLVSSGVKLTSAAISAVPCFFGGINVWADGTNAITVAIYDDNAAAQGTVLHKVRLAATGGPYSWQPFPAVQAKVGVYVEITGGGTSGCIVYTR